MLTSARRSSCRRWQCLAPNVLKVGQHRQTTAAAAAARAGKSTLVFFCSISTVFDIRPNERERSSLLLLFGKQWREKSIYCCCCCCCRCLFSHLPRHLKCNNFRKLFLFLLTCWQIQLLSLSTIKKRKKESSVGGGGIYKMKSKTMTTTNCKVEPTKTTTVFSLFNQCSTLSSNDNSSPFLAGQQLTLSSYSALKEIFQNP